MKSNYLFDYKFKKWGWLFFIPSFILGVLFPANSMWKVPVISLFHKSGFGSKTKDGLLRIFENEINDEVAMIGVIIGVVLIALSKEKVEDEYIAQTRLNSLLWTLYFYYGLFLFTILFIYDDNFMMVLFYGHFVFLIFFLMKFRYTLYKNKKQIGDEE